MTCMHFSSSGERRVVATSTTEVFVPTTHWFIALGIDVVRVGMRLLADQGGIQGRPAYQTAVAVIDESGSGGRNDPQGLGTPSAGPLTPLSFALNLGTVRFGEMVSLAQAGAPGQADLLLQVTIPACGRSLGRFSDQIHIGGNTSPAVTPVTPFVPALNLAEVRAALVVTGVSGALATQLMIQTADVSATTPNPWQALGSPQQGARKHCENHDVTNYTDPGTGPKPMLARLGLSYALVSGSSEAYASVGIDVAGRWG